ncbi:LCP family protein [Streptomyces sp. RFCAC02]|uniref:LCP family protein n=1 Tax=Streptomyces sp. RFCAC02 TaxID=2499143 RepID=UPI001020AC4E|nr:LCP family protein [Streptomyces sp. RFCAC02]
MNDRQDPYGQIYGYDAYGRPLYRAEPPDQTPAAGYQDPQYGYPQEGYPQQDYGQYGAEQYGQDPYGQPYQQPYGEQGYDPYAAYGTSAPAAPAPEPVAEPAQPEPEQEPEQEPEPRPERPGAAAPPPVPPQRDTDDTDYRTEQFAFVDEQNDEVEDVIDWLKFSESRTERREEAKRRGRSRRRLLVILLVLAVIGGTGALWATGRLPFLPGPGEDDGAAGPGGGAREVILVHLRAVDSDDSSTALLVADGPDATGTTLLLPDELAVIADGMGTTLAQAVVQEGASTVRDAVSNLLGTDISGSWRLDTPYLQNLVDQLGGVRLSTDVEVPGEDGGEPLVPLGDDMRLSGASAVAYATYRADDEPAAAQLQRFGAVLEAVLDTMPTDEESATGIVRNLQQIVDPSLSEEELGASLAALAAYAQDDAYTTTVLPAEEDGTISDETAEGLVADVLDGTVSNANPDGIARIGVRDATGVDGTAEEARITLLNGGFTVVDARATDEPADASQVTYSDEAFQETAIEAARTLGLSEDVVTQGETSANADVTIVLGGDYDD